MQNALTVGKRAFTIAIAAATILWSISAAAFVAPLSASAQTTLSNGDLIKGSLSTVYYYRGGERFTFPNEKTYFTWYTSFADVMTISDTQLASYPLAGNIVVRPGTWMIKVDTDPKTYAVTRGGDIHWVETEEVATDLYGDEWNQWIIDVPDVFFTDYDEGASMMVAEFLDGMLVASGTNTYLIWDGEKRLVTSAGMTANRLQSRFIITDSSVSLSDYPTGSTIDGEVPALTDTSQQTTTEVVAEGGLTVSLNDDSPSGQTIPANATNVQLMAVDFEAMDADISISNLTFHFRGVAETDVLDDVYLYWNGARLTNGKTINATTRNVSFTGLDVDVMDGDTETLWVTADVADVGFGTATVGFELEDEDAIVSTAESINGDFPVQSGMNTLTDSASVGTVTIDETGSLSDVTIGEEGAEIAKFTLAADDEDALVQSITLNVESADDHSEYQLWQSTTLLADGESIGSDLVLFELDEEYTVLDGNTKTFTVTAKIGGDPGDTIGTGLEEQADLVAIGGDFGFGMEVTNDMGDTGSACASTADDCSFVDIIGGKLTFAFNGPSSANDLQIGGDNQDIFDFTVTSQNAATINSIEFDITMSNVCDAGEEANFESFEIIDENGIVLMGPEELTAGEGGCGSPQALVFEDEFDMEAGESMDLSLVVDILDTGDAVDGDTIQATMDSSETSAEDSEGNDLVVGEDIIPSADLVGNEFTLTDASLTITVASTPTDGTVVKGSQDVDMVGFSFDAGDASDILVTDASFSVLVEDAAAGTEFEGSEDTADFAAEDRITSCSLYNADGDLVDGPEALDSDAELAFNGFEWSIAAGNNERLIVNCDLANLDTFGGTDDRYAVRLDDVTAEDADGDEIAVDIDEDNDDPDGAAGGVPTTVINVTDAGTLDAQLGAASPDGTIIIGSSTDVEVAVFRFTAETESFIVSELTLVNDFDGDCGACSDEVATDVTVTYEDEDGNTVSQTSALSGGEAMFSSLDMFVPADGTADLTVTIDTAAVSASGADAGSRIQIELDSSTVEATGTSSNDTVVDTDSGDDPEADEFELHKTKPTLSKASGSPSGDAFPGDTSEEVLRFNVAADSHGFVTVNEFTFKMTSTDNAGSGWNTCAVDMETSDWSIYNQDDLGTELEAGDGDWTLYEADGGACGLGVLTYANVAFTDSVEVAAGTTETFYLYVDTTGASSIENDQARFDLPRFSDTDDAGISSAIEWVDDTEAGTWTAELVDTLPVTGGVLVY